MGQPDKHAPPNIQTHHHDCCFWPQMEHLKFRGVVTSDKPELREILQNNWPVSFKKREGHNKDRNCSRIKEVKEIEGKATCAPRSDLGPGKEH